jgi:hypothetical protein
MKKADGNKEDEKKSQTQRSKVVTLAEFDKMMKGLMKVKPPRDEK